MDDGVNKCGDCKHFKPAEEDNDFGTCKRVMFADDHPSAEAYALEIALVIDGSGYRGELLTKADFGCVLFRGEGFMKRYDMRVSDIHTGVDAVERPDGGWVKWEDVKADMEQTWAYIKPLLDMDEAQFKKYVADRKLLTDRAITEDV